jgi:hypothetical protein
MTTTKRNITCYCENTFEADIPDSVDVAAEPEAVEDVLRGEFMTVKCPLCGKRLAPEYPCLFFGSPGDRDIFMVPELDRVAYLRGKLPYETGSPWRVAIGFPELAEKLRLVKLGLDDRVIEIMKYYLLTRSAQSTAGESEGTGPADGHSVRSAPERDVTALCSGGEADRIVFQVTGLREGEVAVARLPRDLYGKIDTDVEKRIKEEPFKDFCIPPYVSVRRII